MGVEHVGDVLVRHVQARPLRLPDQVADGVRLVDHHRLDDLLHLVHRHRRLQPLGAQLCHVGPQQGSDLVVGQPGLSLGGELVGHVVDGLVEHVDRPRCHRVEPAGLPPDGDRGDGEHGQGRHDEDDHRHHHGREG